MVVQMLFCLPKEVTRPTIDQATMRRSLTPTSRPQAAMARLGPGLLLTPAIALALCGCAGLQQADVSSASLPEALRILAERHHVCGVAVAVIKHRQRDFVVSASTCVPTMTLHADSVFQAASLSKPVLVYADLKLLAQGKLDLDAPLMKYLPLGHRHQQKLLPAEHDLFRFSLLGKDPINLSCNTLHAG